MLLNLQFTVFLLILFFKILFIFGCVGSLLPHTGFLQLRRVGATLRCGAQASHCGGFSCCGARALGVRASVVVAHGLCSCGLRALERRLSSCGARAQLLRGMWDLSGPGLEPVSPALAGGFLTTAPPGKSYIVFLFYGYETYLIYLLLATSSCYRIKIVPYESFLTSAIHAMASCSTQGHYCVQIACYFDLFQRALDWKSGT